MYFILAPNWFTYSTAVALSIVSARASDKVFGVLCLHACYFRFNIHFFFCLRRLQTRKNNNDFLFLSFIIIMIVFQFITTELEFAFFFFFSSRHSMARTKLNLLWLLESVTISGNLSAFFKKINRFLIACVFTSIIGLSEQTARHQCFIAIHLYFAIHYNATIRMRMNLSVFPYRSTSCVLSWIIDWRNFYYKTLVEN